MWARPPGAELDRFPERALGRLVAELDYTDVDELITAGLHQFLDGFQAKLNVVGNEITQTFFAFHTTP